MPITLKLDTINGSARAEDNEDGIIIVRCGSVGGLPHSGNGQFDPTVLTAALNVAGMPQMGDPHPQYAAARVIRRLTKPTQAVDVVDVEIHYGSETDITALPDNRFKIVRSTTTMMSEQTELDWQYYPIQVWYAAGTDNIQNNYRNRTSKVQRLVPLTSMIATGVLDAKPSINMLRAQGCVNGSDWQGFAPGYWLCAGLDVFYPGNGNRYVVTATFLSKLRTDWAGYAKYEYHETGSMPTVVSAASVRSLVDRPYDGDQPITTYPGITKAHIYQRADLGAIFPIVN
jgi:hypothetical protein